MKKKYEKPQLHIENLRVAQHIAACNIELTATVETSCTGTGSFNDGFYAGNSDNGVFFLLANQSCETKVSDYCYTNAQSSGILINS